MFWDDYLWKLYMTLSLWSYSMYKTLPGSYQNEDTGRDIYQLIKSRGFKYESHFVQTQDGYILQLVRVINPFVTGTKKRRLKPILLQHGFQCTGTLWLIAANGTLDRYGNYIEYIVDSENRPITINGTKEVANTLGYVLATRGYDVWLANYRGSVYSSNHTTLNMTDEEFWKFSMDEMIHFDLPAEIDYILKHTKRTKLSYIGHSQGNLMMLALMSISDRYARKINPFIALSPVFYNLNMSSAIRAITPIKTILRAFPRMVPYSNTTRSLVAHICQNIYIRKLCFQVTYPFFGSFTQNMILDRIPVYLSSSPGGSSSWNAAHFMQMIEAPNGQPEYFDHGLWKNLEWYGQLKPPVYDAGRINSTKMALIYTSGDWLNSLESIEFLKSKLKVKLLDDYCVPDKSYNHLDLIWAKDVGQVVNRRILKILSSA